MSLAISKLFMRRLAAFFYDSLLLIALFMAFTSLAIYFNNGQAIEHIGYKLLMWVLAVTFFVWFWKQEGQTLGMRAWRIKVVNHDNELASWNALVTRAVTGSLLFAITLIYMFFNRQGLAIHDRLSNTRVTQLKTK